MPTATTKAIDLQIIIDDLFLVLSNKEKEVIVKRFSLNNKPKQTLEKIGKKFSVTRERIRQIEKIALNKLKRTAGNTQLKGVSDLALEIINQNGGVLRQKTLVNNILTTIQSTNEVDAAIVKLALAITPNVVQVNRSDRNYSYYRLKTISRKDINQVTKQAIKTLKKKGDVMTESKLITDLSLEAEDNPTPQFILAAIDTDKRLKKVESGYGLMSWRHINPKSIRDKAFIVLKKKEAPMHFEEIAKAIESAGFDKKSVTVQAVHNELIRYEQFVLVGRGLYALKEWGYKKGTVADVIESLLAKKSPMTKQEITSGVLKQRHVKKGTISLNLQKNPHFVRVGRALYSLDSAKKPAKK